MSDQITVNFCATLDDGLVDIVIVVVVVVVVGVSSPGRTMSTGAGSLFRGILSSLYTPGSRPNRAAGNTFSSPVPTRYLLLQDVPRTARASDVLRVLKDSGTVAKSFPLSASE